MRSNSNHNISKILIEAVKAGNLDVVMSCLAERVDANTEVMGSGQSILAIAIEKGHQAIAKALLDAGADIASIDRQTAMTPLMQAFTYGRYKIAEDILNKIDQLPVEEQKKLIQQKEQREFDTPLHLAVRSMFFYKDRDSSLAAELIARLLKLGANPNAGREGGFTPLSFAMDNKDETIIKLLKEHGAVLERNDIDGMHHVFDKVHSHRYVDARKYVNRGADINQPDINGNTVLMKAIYNPYNERYSPLSDVVALVNEFSADLNATNKDGYTALHFYAMDSFQYHDDTAKAISDTLLQRGADLNKKNHAGQTPIQLAAKNGNIDKVDMLIERGAIFKREELVNALSESDLDDVDKLNKLSSLERVLEKHAKNIATSQIKNTSTVFSGVLFGGSNDHQHLSQLPKELLIYIASLSTDYRASHSQEEAENISITAMNVFEGFYALCNDPEKPVPKHVVTAFNNLDFSLAFRRACDVGAEMVIKYLVENREIFGNFDINQQSQNNGKSGLDWLNGSKFLTDEKKAEIGQFLQENGALSKEELNRNDSPTRSMR